MPQIFQVLRCYKCLAFQVHQTKKSNKFACKICDEKQSIKRHYGIGIAKDCRMHVQKLNKMRGEKDESKLEDVSDEYEEENTSNTDDTIDIKDSVIKTSKWSSYIDKQIEETDIDENEIVSETNNKNNKRWQRNNKFEKYKTKKNFALKRKHRHNDDVDENELDFNESIIDNSTRNDFCKKPLFENDSCTNITKVNKPTQDMTLPRNNSQFKDDLKAKTPKLETPIPNKSSKWAQFIESEVIGEENCDEVEHVSKNVQPLFSLCDDCDIDDVLNI